MIICNTIFIRRLYYSFFIFITDDWRWRMSESYVECLIKHKTPTVKVFLRILFTVLTVLFALLIFMAGFLALIMAVVCGVLSYFMTLEGNVEYEYLYVDREISIDKISGQKRRKTIEKLNTEKIEILAPVNSWHLDEYKNRQLKQKDYSIGYEAQPDQRYVLIYNNEARVLLSPNPAFVAAVKSVAPRKVFTD